MSSEIIEAAFKESAREDGFIPMFVVTPRQVDANRGYTGWSQEDLVELLDSKCKKYDCENEYILARDHGGPYQSMRDRDDSEVELKEAMRYAKETFRRDLRANFKVLHVDATEDPSTDNTLEFEEVANRTLELISSIERTRKEEKLHKPYYEVGTEEIAGGLTEPEDFEEFIKTLKEEFSEKNQDVFQRMIFMVGEVGTTMRIDRKNNFDIEQAKKLVKIASDYDLFLKVHYTDWLDTSDLRKFPEIGIGAANVGPEFAGTIVQGLEELERKEKEYLENEKKYSNFMKILGEETIKKAPWEKFAPENLNKSDLDNFAREKRSDISICVGRYVLEEKKVKKARKNLYENVIEHSPVKSPDSFIVDKIQEKIHRYVKAFNI